MMNSENKSMQEVYFHRQAMIKSGALHFECQGQKYQFSDIVSHNPMTNTVKLKNGDEISFEANVEVTFGPITRAFR